MGSKPRIPAPTAVGRLKRRLSNSSRRLRKRQLCPRSSTHIGGAAAAAAASSVSGKLAALRNLIPSAIADTKPDQLFRETADYIVLLETQVLVLQKLVDFYGSQSQENRDGV
ncbi:transcription factor UPBEAT1 [Salvia miltiorrhiza]|uniref:transcription factor UPBEAT1 n=1 Tax=Salvia miltiorrhiza TaxID=226208 RepID=UPI0025AC1A89|nr:transcription factor UPBEAT1 [Salvia miltiorrhiza]